jgi:tetratricopeptide (TPR) repeat protein
MKVAADVALNAGDIGAARQLIADLGNDARVLDAAQESSSFAAEVAARRRELATSAGRMYWETGRHHAAVASSPLCSPPSQVFPGPLAARGITYRLMGRHKDAIADLGAAIDADPSYALALANRGEVRRLDRQYSDALIRRWDEPPRPSLTSSTHSD